MAQPVVEVEAWLTRFAPVAERLQSALAAVMYVSGDDQANAVDAARAFDLGRTMSWRLFRVVHSKDPREVATLLPGRPTMERLMGRAPALGTKPALIEELRAAYEDFQREVSRVADSQRKLQSFLREHDPQVLEAEAVRKRAALFRAAVDVVGGYAKDVSVVVITWPNRTDPSKGDVAAVQGYHGLRRTGSMDPLCVFTRASLDEAGEEHRIRRLDGASIEAGSDGARVHELSDDMLQWRSVRTGDAVYSVYMGEDLPEGRAFDLFEATLQERWIRNIRAGERGCVVRDIVGGLPIEAMIFDMILHKDMWPGITPRFRLYKDARGAFGNSPEQMWFREVTSYETMEAISAHRLMIPPGEAPKHMEVVRYALDKSGIDLADYRVYRLVMRYPVMGRAMCVFFERD